MSAPKSFSSIDVEYDTEDILLIASDDISTSLTDTEMTCNKIRSLLKSKKKP
jgi:hypothetical protein